jgi:hypothetical protein
MRKQDLWTAVVPVLRGLTQAAALKLETILILRLKPGFNMKGKFAGYEERMRAEFEERNGPFFARRPYRTATGEPAFPELYAKIKTVAPMTDR